MFGLTRTTCPVEMMMKIGDLVKNLSSESKMTGVIVGWSDHQMSDPQENRRDPVVLWADGRCNWIVRHKAKVVG